MGKKSINGPVFVTVIVAIVAVVGFLLWRSSAPPEPVLGAGQSIEHPLGTAGAKTPGNMPQDVGPAWMHHRRQ